MKTLRFALGALCVVAAAHAAAQTKLKFAIFTPDKEQTFLTVMKPWAEAVNKEAAGAIDIELYPNGALGRSPLQQAQTPVFLNPQPFYIVQNQRKPVSEGERL